MLELFEIFWFSFYLLHSFMSFQKKNYLNEIIIHKKKIEKILLPVLCFDQLKGFPE
jgi:hypothetical protein